MPLALHPDGNTVLTRDDFHKGPLRLLNLSTGEERRLTPDDVPGYRAVAAFSPDGRLAAVGLSEVPYSGKITIWDWAAGKPVARISIPGRAIGAVAFSPDGKWLVTVAETGGSLRNTIQVWDLARLGEGGVVE